MTIHAWNRGACVPRARCVFRLSNVRSAGMAGNAPADGNSYDRRGEVLREYVLRGGVELGGTLRRGDVDVRAFEAMFHHRIGDGTRPLSGLHNSRVRVA